MGSKQAKNDWSPSLLRDRKAVRRRVGSILFCEAGTLAPEDLDGVRHRANAWAQRSVAPSTGPPGRNRAPNGRFRALSLG
jgi:hypothetical protein